MKSIKTNIFLNCIRTGITVLIPFFSFQYASRVLGTVNIGKINFSSSIANYIILFAALGISSFAIRECAKKINNKEDFNRIISDIFSLNVISTVIAYFVLFLLIVFSKKINNYATILVIQCIPIVFTLIGTDWINIIMEDYKFITIRTLFFQLLTFLVTIIIVKSKNDYVLFVIIQCLGKALPDLINFAYIRKKYLHIKFQISKRLLPMIKPVIIIFLNTLVISIYVSFDTTMIGLMIDDLNVGYYSVSVKIYTVLKTVFSAIVSVTVPRMSKYLAMDNIDYAKKLVSQLINHFTNLVIPVVIFLIVVSHELIIILFGMSYYNSIIPLQILYVGVIFSVYACLITNTIFLPLRLEKYSLISTTISAITNFILNLFFISYYGIIGAAITTAISEIIVFFISYYFLKKEDITFFKWLNYKKTFKTVLLSISIIIFSVLVRSYVQNIYFIFAMIALYTVGVVIYIYKNEVLNLIKK